MISVEDEDNDQIEETENLVTYNWPEVFVPKNVRISQFVVEKLRFYGDQQFVVKMINIDCLNYYYFV